MIYKILREIEYMDLVIDGKTKGSPIDFKDGYIHFSTLAQLEGTLAKHFEGEAILHLLAVNEKSLDNLKWEEARGGDLFPHLYGELLMNQVEGNWEINDHQIPRGLE